MYTFSINTSTSLLCSFSCISCTVSFNWKRTWKVNIVDEKFLRYYLSCLVMKVHINHPMVIQMVNNKFNWVVQLPYIRIRLKSCILLSVRINPKSFYCSFLHLFTCHHSLSLDQFSLCFISIDQFNVFVYLSQLFLSRLYWSPPPPPSCSSSYFKNVYKFS
jgi:hypothetical protein